MTLVFEARSMHAASNQLIARHIARTEAETIVAQLGNKFRVMTGAKDFTYDGEKHSLTFRIGRNAAGVNMVRVTLRADLYEVEALSMRGASVKVKAEASGVYADRLAATVGDMTGMAVTL